MDFRLEKSVKRMRHSKRTNIEHECCAFIFDAITFFSSFSLLTSTPPDSTVQKHFFHHFIRAIQFVAFFKINFHHSIAANAEFHRNETWILQSNKILLIKIVLISLELPPWCLRIYCYTHLMVFTLQCVSQKDLLIQTPGNA